jgi:hypothetical protein
MKAEGGRLKAEAGSGKVEGDAVRQQGFFALDLQPSAFGL